MNFPTEDQLRAAELVCMYEGSDRASRQMIGNSYEIETDTNVYYIISPSGETIMKSTGWITDTAELTERLCNPGLFEDYDPDPGIDRIELRGPVTDFHEDRQAEFSLDQHWSEWERAWEKQMDWTL